MAKKRAVLYARVSGDDRDKEGRNLKGQIEMCREYALGKGYQVIEELSEDDRGANSASFDLEQLNRALEMARAGEFDVLVVRELDRFARSLAKQLIVEQEFKRAGVEVDYVLGEYPDTPEGNLNKNIKAVIAEYERLKIAERLTRGRRQKVQDGHVSVAGRPPYGYRVGKKENGTGPDGKPRYRQTLLPYEPEARFVRMVFTWYAEGDEQGRQLSISGVTNKLNELHAPTYTESNARPDGPRTIGELGWVRDVVWRMLKNPVYVGIWYYGKSKMVDGRRVRNPREHWLSVAVPAIVSQELWSEVQARLKINRQRMGKRKWSYLLSGRGTCGKCGHAVGGQGGLRESGQLYQYYLCWVKATPTAHRQACDLPSFRVDQVDPAIWEWVKSWLSDSELLADGLEAYRATREEQNAPLRARLDAVNDLLQKEQAELGRLLALYLSGDFPREMLVDRKNRYETTTAALERERGDLTATLDRLALTEDQIVVLQEFAAQIASKIDVADASFAARQRIIDILDVRVVFTVEDGQQVLYASCGLGSGIIPGELFTTNGKQLTPKDTGWVFTARIVLEPLPRRKRERKQGETT